MRPRLHRDLTDFSVTDLQREISRREGRTEVLQWRRESLLQKLAAIDAELGTGPRTATRGHRGRPPSRPWSSRGPGAKNTTTLTDALAAALKDKTMGIADAADAVKAAGYKSDAANFKLMVNATLLKGPSTKAARGRYTAK